MEEAVPDMCYVLHSRDQALEALPCYKSNGFICEGVGLYLISYFLRPTDSKITVLKVFVIHHILHSILKMGNIFFHFLSLWDLDIFTRYVD